MIKNLSNRDVVWGFAAQFFSIASGIVILPLILRLLSPSEIGMNYLMLTVGSMVALFDFGFAPQFARNITYIFSGAQALKKEGLEVLPDQKKEVNYRLLATMISTAKKVYSILSIIVLFIMLTFGTLYIFKVTDGFASVHNSLIIWVIFSISTFVNIYFTYYHSLLTGMGMIMEYNKAMVSSKILSIILTVLFLALKFGLLGVAIANLLSPFLYRFLSYRYFFTPNLKEKLNNYNISKTEKSELFDIIWHNSKKLGLVYIGSYAISKLSLFLAGLYLPLKEVASYGLMLQLVGLLSTISGTFFVVNNPKFSSMKISGKNKELLDDFAFTMGIYYILFIVGAIGLLFIVPFAMSLMKSNIALPSFTVMFIYLLIMLLEGNHSFFATMIAIGNKIPFMWISLITGGAIGLLSFLSLEFSGLGILGLVLSQGLVQILYNNWKWPFEVCKDFKVSFYSFFLLSFYKIYDQSKNRFFRDYK